MKRIEVEPHRATGVDEPGFYAHAPTHTNPSAAPVGADTLMVLVPVGHLDTHRQTMENLAQHLKFDISFTPRDWKSHYNLAKRVRLA